MKKYETNDFSDKDYWISEWLKSDNRSSQHTQEAYKRDVNTFLNMTAKTFDLVDVQDILNYESHLKDEGLARSTVGRKISAVRSFYTFLNRREISHVNLEKLEPRSIQRTVDHSRFLTEKEIAVLIEAARPSLQDWLFVRTLYLTALRISEILSIRWRDLTPMNGGGEAQVIRKRKKQKPVFIPNELYADLEQERGNDNDFIFPSLSRLKAWRMIQKLAKAASIDKKVSPHSFRHAHLSHAIKNGATLADVRDQADHANISTTSLYIHAESERATATRLKVR